MSLSTNLISGLSSGFDWRSMIDQLIAIEHSRVDLVEDRKTESESKLSEWQSFNTMLLSLKTAAENLKEPEDFYLYTSNMTSNDRDVDVSGLLSVSTSSSASKGTCTIKVLSLATAEKLSSASFSSASEALGSSYAGDILINGRVVNFSETDALTDVMNKINNLNSGSNPSGLTATIVTYSTYDYRLTLTSDTTGQEGIGLLNGGATDILNKFGFIDTGRTVKNQIAGGDKSDSFTSVSVDIKTLLGLSTAQTSALGEIKINGEDVAAIDLSAHSLTDIMGKFNAVDGVNASIITETVDGMDYHRILIEGASTYTDKNNILETLGILEGAVGDVVGDVGTKAMTTEGQAIDSSTLLVDIDGYLAHDAQDHIDFDGFDTSGVVVTFQFDIETDTTVQNLLSAIETKYEDVTASITGDGKIQIVDNTTDTSSDLRVNFSDRTIINGDLDFGLTGTDPGTIRKREVVGANDASILVDGVTVTKSDNTVDDVLTGVTLNFLKADTETEITLNIDRDIDAIMDKISSFVDSYNAVASYIYQQQSYDTENETTGGVLFGDSTLSSVKLGLTSVLLQTVSGVSFDFSVLGLVGINLDNEGQLSINTDTLQGYLETDFNEIKLLFASNGTTDEGTLEYIGHTLDTVPGEYTVHIDQAATQRSETGTIDLSSGGLSGAETLTITEGNKTARIELENGWNLSTIVDTINTELDTVTTEILVGANTLYEGSGMTTEIDSNTTWDDVYVGADPANLEKDDEVHFEGNTRSGASVSGYYKIENVSTDKIQGLLSAIELAYENEITASVDSEGRIVITDKYSGNSALSITFDYTQAHDLDFGDVDATPDADDGSQEGRYTIAVTASASGDSKYLILTQDNYGSGASFTISQSGEDTSFREVFYSDTANTTTASSGQIYVSETTKWDEIYGTTVNTGDTITIAGIKHDGSGVAPIVEYELDVEGEFKAISTLLSAIETAFGGDLLVDVRIEDGKIVVEDLQSDEGALFVNLYYENEGEDSNLDMGAIGERTTRDLDLGLVNGTFSGLNVAGTIKGEAATGSGQILTGNDGEANIDGLAVKYTGTDEGIDAGDITLTIGVAELFYRVLFDITDPYEGYVSFKQDSLQNSIDEYETRIGQMEVKLALKVEMMINRFVAMELAMSKMQSQSQWLMAQIGVSLSGWRSL